MHALEIPEKLTLKFHALFILKGLLFMKDIVTTVKYP